MDRVDCDAAVAEADADAEVVAAADDPDALCVLNIRNSALACDILDRIVVMQSHTGANGDDSVLSRC